MNRSLFNTLINPTTGNKLVYDASKQTLNDARTGESYEIVDNVPVVLPDNHDTVRVLTKQHENAGTEFSYIHHYQKDAETSHYFGEYDSEAANNEIRRLYQAIIREVPKTAKNILDVGCGKAWVANYFCNRGVEVYSLDISHKNPWTALQKYPYENHYALAADAFNLPFEEGYFDSIIASEIIEHVYDPQAFIASLLSKLKRKGILIITTPYNEKLKYSLCIHCNNLTPRHAHIHSFTEKSLLDYCPLDEIADYKTYAFSNKALAMLRTHVILGWMSFKLWRIVDRAFNAVIKKQSRLLLKLTKK